ncbi:putative secreted glycosyl hydrolase [Rhodococcus sp. MTM3W5.2]|uniref:F510_1955 family glycosylhydrolase n=1 Tax=Rhodococcus sp. MTM3W5.2 TaxID=1805827 RepID=UPI0009796B6C|nr:exo-alpha-sialidase [Rhodococcus sp. MTM3W5.2]AQA22516.1 putative secreted glycosyl hydrolase [Rhodococcus sp. MTM3W5.2]
MFGGGADSALDAAAAPSPRMQSVPMAPALDHLHGLHVATRGTVLAGTHTGLYAVGTSGRTERVGARDDDLMGLAGVAQTDTLYSSGHPGPSSAAPNPLGLKESTDGGRTWRARSLAGEVDFHALASDGELLVGFDGTGGLRVSTDRGTTWAAGAALPAASLAIAADGVWAVTPDGLQRSTDVALSFTVVEGAPDLVIVSAGADGSLWGVDAGGTAWRSDLSRSWQRVAEIGEVEALAAADYGRAYAATSRVLHTLG